MEFYFQHSLAPSSQRSYSSAQGRYTKFCSLVHISPFPLSEHNLCHYVSYLAQENVPPASIKCYLSALHHLQIERNMPDPKISCMPRLEAVIKGIKRTHSKDPPRSKPRLPITPTILLSLRHLWEEEGEKFDNIMLWAACCTCSFGFMRAGEITIPSQDSYDPSSHLSFEDITVDSILNPIMVHVRLNCSETDPFRLGGLFAWVGRLRSCALLRHFLRIWLFVAARRAFCFILRMVVCLQRLCLSLRFERLYFVLV